VPVIIRLKRFGSNKKPYFRIMVMDSRMSGKGRRVEDVGTYNPRAKENPVMNLKKEVVSEWIKKGAIPSGTVRSILKKAGMEIK
jgi:small subunit ribosomal protein S16